MSLNQIYPASCATIGLSRTGHRGSGLEDELCIASIYRGMADSLVLQCSPPPLSDRFGLLVTVQPGMSTA